MKMKAIEETAFYHRRPVTYSWIIAIWLITMAIFEYCTIRYSIIPVDNSRHYLLESLVILNQVFVATFFFWNFQFGYRG